MMPTCTYNDNDGKTWAAQINMFHKFWAFLLILIVHYFFITLWSSRNYHKSNSGKRWKLNKYKYDKSLKLQKKKKEPLVINLIFLWFEKRPPLFNFINRVLLPNEGKTNSKNFQSGLLLLLLSRFSRVWLCVTP